MHAEGKPIPHEGNNTHPAEALLHETAERTVGYSGAELAGLLNEASILAVCLPHIRLLTADWSRVLFLQKSFDEQQ